MQKKAPCFLILGPKNQLQYLKPIQLNGTSLELEGPRDAAPVSGGPPPQSATFGSNLVPHLQARLLYLFTTCFTMVSGGCVFNEQARDSCSTGLTFFVLSPHLCLSSQLISPSMFETGKVFEHPPN